MIPEAPSPQVTCNVLNLLGAGVHLDVACRCNGITFELLNKWIECAQEDPHSLFGEFLRLADIAVAQDEARDIMLIGSGVKYAAALQWKLTRKAPNRWGDRVHHSVDTAGLLQSTDDAVIVPTEDVKAKMIAIMNEVGAFRDLEKSDPELASALEIESVDLPDGPVNGSGKKVEA